MKKIWLTVIGAAILVLAVVGFTGCSPEGATFTGGSLEIKGSLNSQQEGIWVSGEGKVTAVPDVANLRLGIQSQEGTVAEAQGKAAAAMDSVMKSLKGNGVAEKDIQTQTFNIQKVTRWDNDNQREIVIGYQVTNIVTAKIREVGTTGRVIDAVTIAGGDLTRVDSISFSIDNPAAYYGEARQKAVADAAAKAKQLADVTGVKLGKPTYISENVYVPGPVFRGAMMEAAAPAPVETPISPGEQEITMNVQIAYAIAD
ncbi:MAG TPA: SIMPL domain-containing protein [Dehalococcoidales bacterium]|nr:MAG: hypothetical protein A2Z05_03850 [Chloroflexi bacterium RBG_16_60_22]HJX14045.1 SIMPL domain-containing protein [Dehalococcoidales bacterium]